MKLKFNGEHQLTVVLNNGDKITIKEKGHVNFYERTESGLADKQKYNRIRISRTESDRLSHVSSRQKRYDHSSYKKDRVDVELFGDSKNCADTYVDISNTFCHETVK